MNISPTKSVYYVVLTDHEWYGADQEHQASLKVRFLQDAENLGCQHIAVMVDPDGVLSISPIARKHLVWGHSFPLKLEDELYEALMKLARNYIGPDKLSIKQAWIVAKRVFG